VYLDDSVPAHAATARQALLVGVFSSVDQCMGMHMKDRTPFSLDTFANLMYMPEEAFEV